MIEPPQSASAAVFRRIISIFGENRFQRHSRVHVACRGIVVREDQVLMTYETNTDQWFIPGGGLEGEESLADCCVRELAEETGFAVLPGKHFLTIHEYYEDRLFVSHYFVCHAHALPGERLRSGKSVLGLNPGGFC